MNRVQNLRSKAPELLENQEVFDLAAKADELHELKALSDTEGGKQLTHLLLKSVVNNVYKLITLYKTAPDVELRATIAAIDTELNVARVILNAKEGLDVLDQELATLLSE